LYFTISTIIADIGDSVDAPIDEAALPEETVSNCGHHLLK